MNKILIAFLVAGCAIAEGEPCTVDSDCESGLICSFEHTCEPPASLITDTHCEEQLGVFQSTTSACAEPTTIHSVISLTIADKDNGLANLAPLANGVIKGGFENDSVSLDLAVDGTLDPECDADIAWVVGEDWRNADCTPVYNTTFPLSLPGLGPDSSNATFTVYSAVFDRASNVLSGYVIPEEVRAALAPSLQSAVSDDAFVFDTDTDGDGEPDKPSVVVGVGLQQ